MKMPSQEEQQIAEDHVLRRPLVRPDTDFKKIFIFLSLYVFLCFVTGDIILGLFHWLGINSYLPQWLNSFVTNHGNWFGFIVYFPVYLIPAMILRKKAAIGMIKCYQHYAPEYVRRACVFKPTCSEYAILAIKKYGIIKGCRKIYIRTFKMCKGHIYRIDYP